MSLLVILAAVWLLLALATVGLCVAAGLADRAATARPERGRRRTEERPSEPLRTGFPSIPAAPR